MKKVALLTLFLSMMAVISSCKKEDKNGGNPNNPGGNGSITVDAKQRTLLMDFTATWCGPCGANGTPTFKSIADSYGDKIVGFAFHTNTSELTPYFLRNDTAFISPLFPEIFPQSGVPVNNGSFSIPSFTLNQKNVSINESAVKSAIDANYSKSPVAGVGINVVKTAGGVDISSKVKFFDAASGEYSLGLYFVEDHIVHRQNVNTSYVNNFEHQHILRGSAIGTRQKPASFGTSFTSGSISKDQEFTPEKVSYIHDNNPGGPAQLEKWAWKPENTSVIAIIWKKDGTNYTFVNGTVVKIK